MAHPKTTLYENLSIQPNASRSEIDCAYREALKGLEVDALAHYSVDSGEAVAEKRILLEKTYAVLSRPDLKSRYDAGEAVPFAAVLPESQRSANVKAPSRDQDALRRAMKQSKEAGRRQKESEQLKAFRDNFNPDRLRPIAEVEYDLISGKSNIIGTRQERSPDAPNVPSTAPVSVPAKTIEARPAPVSNRDVVSPAQNVKPPAPVVTESKKVSREAQMATSATKARTLPIDILERVGEFAESIEVFTGSKLAELRELAGLSREDMEQITKVNQRHLRSIESDDYTALPVRVYVRGFIQEYARALGLDREHIAADFLRLYDSHRGAS